MCTEYVSSSLLRMWARMFVCLRRTVELQSIYSRILAVTDTLKSSARKRMKGLVVRINGHVMPTYILSTPFPRTNPILCITQWSAIRYT